MSVFLPPIVQQLLGTINMFIATSVPPSVQAIVTPVLTLLTTVQGFATSGSLSSCSPNQISAVIASLNTLIATLIANPVVPATVQAAVSVLVSDILSLLPCAVNTVVSNVCPCPQPKPCQGGCQQPQKVPVLMKAANFCDSSSEDVCSCSSSSSSSSSSSTAPTSSSSSCSTKVYYAYPPPSCDDSSSSSCTSSSTETAVAFDCSELERKLERLIDSKFEKIESRLRRIEEDVKILACTLYKLKTTNNSSKKKK